MQNDFTSSFLSSELPAEAALLGFASSDLPDYISDDEHGDASLLVELTPNWSLLFTPLTARQKKNNFPFGLNLSVSDLTEPLIMLYYTCKTKLTGVYYDH